MNEPLNKIIFIYIKILKYLWMLDASLSIARLITTNSPFCNKLD